MAHLGYRSLLPQVFGNTSLHNNELYCGEELRHRILVHIFQIGFSNEPKNSEADE